jgi:signal transduction histidine kinase
MQKAQEATVRAERLAAVGTLAASLAHEVRNPLNSISLMLVLLKRRLARLADGSDADLAATVENVKREVERLDGLVEEFLSLSTLDRLERQRHDPAAVAREALVLTGPGAAARGVTVREDLPALPPLSIDRQKLKQVLLNLLRNAVEAMPGGGILTVAARREESGVLLEVADTGVGIEPGIDVFDFFTSTKRGGTGLGLPISRRIVEAHGGTLTYASERGRGTVFRVLLPGPEPIPAPHHEERP